MYRLRLDLFPEHSNEVNPEFMFETIREMISFMKVCFANGYDVLVAEMED